MSIQIIDSFQVNTASPIDNRIVASGSVARNAIPYKYEGLRVFDVSDSIPYVWLNGAWVSENASGVVASGTSINYIPLLTNTNVVGSSVIYQSGSNIGVNTTSPSATFSVNGSLSATTLIGDGSGVGASGVIVNAVNITTGSLSLSRLTNGSLGYILTGGGSSPVYVDPSQVSVGTSSVTSKVSIDSSVSNSNHYLAFFAGGAWQSASSGTSSNIKTNISANAITYNPSTNVLNVNKINQSGGSLSSSATTKLNFINLTSTTTNTSNLEFNNIRVSNGSDWLTSGYRIQAKVDTQYLGYIQFNGNNEAGVSIGTGYMGTDGTSNDYQRLRIDLGGRVFIGTASSSSINNNSVLQIRSDNDKTTGIVHRAIGDSNNIFEFLNTSGSSRGKIVGAGSSAVSYATSSDKRLKDDIQDMPSMYNIVKNLKPSKFKWKVDKSEDFGFIAQEVFDVLPSLREKISSDFCDVNDPNFDINNPIDKEGKEHYYSLDYGKLTPYLTKALQETMEKLETLTNKIKSANTLEELKSSL